MTILTRREMLKLIAAAAAIPGPSFAQERPFPNHAVSIFVGAAPGGTSDSLTRALATRMAERLGQPVLIENRPGVGSSVAATATARSAPDGHSLLMSAAAPLIVNQLLMKSMSYDPDKDFASVGTFVQYQILLVTSAASPYKTLADVTQYAKANPGMLPYASGGALGSPHLAFELLQSRLGIQLTHVPYRGDAPAITDVLGGRVPLMTVGMPGVMSLLRSGHLRGVVVYGGGRSAHLPDVPTVTEAGVKDMKIDGWLALSAPARTPKTTIAKLNEAMRFSLANEEVKKQMFDLAGEVLPGSPEELDARIRDERGLWTEIITKSGIQPT
jgi:tripartite-type tricarboxylate transporter receptor subunit TctC